ncbi:epoxyqueuosine reductase [Desulfopila sp. IMCC35008]|uniref:epoxyqueuosine reductase n=1 Tax=Desulfopila sp. IMCC35008 TaxID=2653858 RepID=UPI0013D74318|nr:epoxyqueuosine reductase [Desulfopila sp. IMCC35008]
MRNKIVKEVSRFVFRYQESDKISTSWGDPVVGFASAADPLFEELKNVVVSTHTLPRDLLPDAQTVISFFLPFSKSIAATNIRGKMSSPEWATCYVETNELIKQLGYHLHEVLEKAGEKLVAIPATHNWIEDKLVSNWSHRHVAFIAGLGRFGLNNMLITEKGCSGRIGSLITTGAIPADKRPEIEACLYKYEKSCKKCVQKCVNEALFKDSFDRFKCYAQLLENVEEYKNVGYADVCGKCLVAVPCTHNDPVKLKLKAKN